MTIQKNLYLWTSFRLYCEISLIVVYGISSAAFITRLADNDREQAIIKTKVSTVERKLDTLCTRGYVDNLVKSLEGGVVYF